jgi:hypothetical protein
MIRTAARICLCLALSVSAAEAADTEIKAAFGQTFSASDNRRLAINSPGESYNSISTLLLNAIARTARSTFEVVGNLAYRAYGGPGERMQPDALDKGIVGIATYRERDSKYFISGSYQQRDISTVQIEEDGFATLTGYVNTSTLTGGFERQIGPTDSLSLSTTGSWTDFTTPGRTPFSSISARAAWNRQVNRSLDWVASLEYQRLSYDNATDTQSQIFRVRTGLRSRLSPRLAVAANVGVGWFDTENDVIGFAPAPSGSSYGLLADVLLTYNLWKDTVAVLSASQSMGPNSLGELSKRTSVALNLRHEIDHQSYWALGGQYGRSDQTTAGATNFYVASATYGRHLNKDWRTEISYAYRYRDSVTGEADSNTISFRVSRDWVVKPEAPSGYPADASDLLSSRLDRSCSNPAPC